MARPVAALPALFDLKEESAKLWRVTAHRRRVLLGTVVFLAAIGALAFAIQFRPILTGSLPAADVVDLSIIFGTVIGGICVTVPIIVRLRRGAVLLRVDSDDFRLTYADGADLSVSWTDPRLSFDLIDFSKVNPARLRLRENPYSLTIGGVNSVLSRDAYSALTEQAIAHGLIFTTQRGTRWFVPPDAVPTIHHIRRR